MYQDKPLNRAMGGGGVAASIKKSIASGILQSTETTKLKLKGRRQVMGLSLRITQMEQYARGCLCCTISPGIKGIFRRFFLRPLSDSFHMDVESQDANWTGAD